jgi:hypothetical protein
MFAHEARPGFFEEVMVLKTGNGMNEMLENNLKS